MKNPTGWMVKKCQQSRSKGLLVKRLRSRAAALRAAALLASQQVNVIFRVKQA